METGLLIGIAVTTGDEWGGDRAVMTPTLLFITVAASSVLYMALQHAVCARAALLAKPVPVLLLAVGAVLCGEPRDPTYRWLVVLGLGASAVGDVCLALPGDRFLPGLIAFLIGHVLYLVAFLHGVPTEAWDRGIPFVVVYGTIAGAIFASLYPRLGALRIPCAVYVLAICAMATAAGLRGQIDGSPAAPVGAALFFASDAVLAIDRFRFPLPGARIVLFTLYAAGQAAITASIWR
jgi:uncharacterized membrane protein YhhN